MQKRILLIGHIDGVGGAQTAFQELYKFVVKQDYVVKLIAITDNGTDRKNTYDHHLLTSIPHIGSSIFFQLKKWIIILSASIRARKFNPDLFVSVGLSNSSNFISSFLGKYCYKIGQDFIAGRDVSDNIWISSRKHMDGIAVQAPSMLKYWSQKLQNLDRLNWLPCFPSLPVEGILHENNASTKNIKLAYFGRLAANKGLPLLLEAISNKDSFSHVSLDLWGNGTEETFLKKKVAKLQLEDRVRFMGKYPAAQEGAKLMSSYDALLLTSTYNEGLPLILLESMAYGIPFLATNVGAIQDCCIDNPDTILVQPTLYDIRSGVAELVDKIGERKFNPERLRDFYKKNFSYEVMADRWKMCLNNPKTFFYEQQ